MRKEVSNVDLGRREEQERNRRKEALDVLLEARDKLLSQMAQEIVSHREVILDGSSQEGLFGFELQEIEDRYSARLNALNALLDNLEYRHPQLEHRVETVTTTLRTLKNDIADLLVKFGQWDLVSLNVLHLNGEGLMVLAAFTSEEYQE